MQATDKRVVAAQFRLALPCGVRLRQLNEAVKPRLSMHEKHLKLGFGNLMV